MSDEQMAVIAARFPSLRGKPGTKPWDPLALDLWAYQGKAVTGGSLHAARFALSIWNHDASWKVGPFNLVAAFGTWDEAHREAFLAWCREPFFP